MAIDFNNKNRDDANGVFTTTPAPKTGWIETGTDGAWTGKFSPSKPANATGWREVGYATVTLNDGRQFRVVLDGSGQPISEIGEQFGTDDDQAGRFKDRQTQAQRAAATAERKVKSEYPGVFPPGHPLAGQPAMVTEYESGDPKYVAIKPDSGSATKPAIGRVEGTPLPGGGFDNSKPIWVERDPSNNQQVGPAKPLTADQRAQWEREKNGGNTDAEVRERNSPENRVGKPTGNTRTKAENGKTVKETEYLLPDGTKEWRTQEETAPPDRIGKPTGNTRERNEGGKAIKETEYILPDGTKEWRTQEAPSTTNQPLPAGMPTFRPDANKPGLGVIEYAEQLTALRASGKLTDKQFAEFIGYAHSTATAEATRLDSIAATQRQQQANEISQRATDIQASTSRLGAANTATQNALDTSQKMAGNFTNASYAKLGGPILPAVMALQDARAGAWGGLNQPAPIGTGQYPMLQQMGQMGMPAQNPNTVIPAVAALGAPAVAPAAAPVAPAGPPPFAPRTAMPNAVAPGQVARPVTPAVAPPAVGMNPDAGQALGPTGNSGPLPQPGMNPDAGQGLGPTGDSGPLVPAQPFVRPGGPAGAGNVQMAPPQQPGVLPAVNMLGIMAEMNGQYPDDVLHQAARELGWL